MSADSPHSVSCGRCGARLHWAYNAWWDGRGEWPCFLPPDDDPEAAHVPAMSLPADERRFGLSVDLCRRCDMFVGFGAAGVYLPPQGRDVAWLAGHCWVCGRSREEVRADGRR